MYYKVARLPIGYAPPPERDNVVTVPPLVFPSRPIKLPHSGGGEEKMTDSFLTRCHMRAPARTIIRSSSIPPAICGRGDAGCDPEPLRGARRPVLLALPRFPSSPFPCPLGSWA